MTTRPNFLIIGANKGGTTSLFHYLGQHPQVFVPENKEPMFFTHYQENGEDGDFRGGAVVKTFASYERLFEGSEGFRARGEASTTYLANPHCAPNIHDYVPEMNLIAILRCPVERAFSNYLMYVRWNDETRSFSQALRDELDGAELPQGKQYIYLGRYLESLQTFRELFGKNQLRIYLMDDLKDRPSDTYRDICEYLDIDTDFQPDFSVRHNTNDSVEIRFLNRYLKKLDTRTNFSRLLPGTIRERLVGKPRMSQKDRDMLCGMYRDEVDQLSEFLDRDLSHWLRPA